MRRVQRGDSKKNDIKKKLLTFEARAARYVEHFIKDNRTHMKRSTDQRGSGGGERERQRERPGVAKELEATHPSSDGQVLLQSQVLSRESGMSVLLSPRPSVAATARRGSLHSLVLV